LKLRKKENASMEQNGHGSSCKSRRPEKTGHLNHLSLNHQY
jgi:hypothetical protein